MNTIIDPQETITAPETEMNPLDQDTSITPEQRNAAKLFFIETILQDLNTPHVFPLGALVNAKYFKAALEPYLLTMLEQGIEDAKQDKEPSRASFYALYLLNELSTPQLYPILFKILRLQETQLDLLVDPRLTESIARMLAAQYTGTFEAIWEIFDNQQCCQRARHIAFNTLVILLLQEKISSDALTPLIKVKLMQAIDSADKDMAKQLVKCILHTRLSGVYDVARQAYQQNLIDDELYSLEFFDHLCSLPIDSSAKDFSFTNSAYNELKYWAYRNNIPPIGLGGKLLVKIGRNDACFCRSGKKYKKCCLNETRSARASQEMIHEQN